MTRLGALLLLFVAACARPTEQQVRSANHLRFARALDDRARAERLTFVDSAVTYELPADVEQCRDERGAIETAVIRAVPSGPSLTVDCQALRRAAVAGGPLDAVDEAGAPVLLVGPQPDAVSEEQTVLARRADGSLVLLRPSLRAVSTRSYFREGMSCCCDMPHEPRRGEIVTFWTVAGARAAALRTETLPFQGERVEVRCDPDAPQ